ncbi:MAG: ABC transporter substrate-binding protein [Chthoniobacteraceae bacterium]|nr:ABC transporter substrate-binding protein [Chthoniobacteraceae bacterium]
MKHLLLSALLTLSLAAGALAQSPQAEVKATTDAILAQLKDPKVQGDDKKAERRQLVRAAMEKRFAWEDSARACLGPQWLKRTPAEKTEFVQLFSEFLKDTYSEKIATYYGDLDSIAYRGEKILEGDYASVKMVLTTKAKVDHPVEYRMNKKADGWKVYDVVIEGVSLVKNYRDQFDAIIAKSSYDGLIKEIKAKKPSSL